jgi:hypothetical protein
VPAWKATFKTSLQTVLYNVTVLKSESLKGNVNLIVLCIATTKLLSIAIPKKVYSQFLPCMNAGVSLSGLDEDDEKTKEFAKNPEWQELISKMNVYFQRINSRTMKEI